MIMMSEMIMVVHTSLFSDWYLTLINVIMITWLNLKAEASRMSRHKFDSLTEMTAEDGNN